MAPAPRPSALHPALGVALLCACFAPSGSDSTGAGSTTGTSAATTSSATTTTSTASTSAAPTTGATSDPTTGGPVPDQGVPAGVCANLTALDLDSNLGGFTILAEPGRTGTGLEVTGIGDFNGDTLADVRVLEMPADVAPCQAAAVWRNYVVFGTSDPQTVQLASAPQSPFVADHRGFFIEGVDACLVMPCDNQFGLALSPLGDLDGDARADLIVGAPRANTNLGRVYIMHGRDADGSNLRADAVIADPIDHVIEGGDNFLAGSTVAGLGDIDGDLIPDHGIYVSGPSRAIYVVYGAPSPALDPVFLGDLMPPDLGYRIGDPAPDGYHDFGPNLHGGYDFDGDAVPDLLLDTGPEDFARVVVVFGNAGRNQDNASLDAFIADERATVLQCSVNCGYSARFLGDINGDGLADIAAGEREFDSATGRVAVIFGAPEARTIDINAIPAGQGFLVHGESGGDYFGFAVDGADVDGDGLVDLVIGAPGHDGNRGRVYVVLGRVGLSDVALAPILAGQGGFVVDGDPSHETMFGTSLARGGRVNGDAYDDIVVGAPGVAPGECAPGVEPGRAYVVYGASCRG